MEKRERKKIKAKETQINQTSSAHFEAWLRDFKKRISRKKRVTNEVRVRRKKRCKMIVEEKGKFYKNKMMKDKKKERSRIKND